MIDDLKKQACQHRSTVRGWHNPCCGKPAKMKHDGKHYCGIHDPVKRKAKRLAGDAAFIEKINARNQAHKSVEKSQLELERRAGLYDELVSTVEMLTSTEFLTTNPIVQLVHHRKALNLLDSCRGN